MGDDEIRIFHITKLSWFTPDCFKTGRPCNFLLATDVIVESQVIMYCNCQQFQILCTLNCMRVVHLKVGCHGRALLER